LADSAIAKPFQAPDRLLQTGFGAWISDHADTARAWLLVPRHHEFQRWIDVPWDDTTQWSTLQDCIYQVLGIDGTTLLRAETEVCHSVIGEPDLTSTPHGKDQDKIGDLLAVRLLELSSVAWKDEAVDWTRAVCKVWSHRAIFRWKRTCSRDEGARSTGDARGPADGNGARSVALTAVTSQVLSATASSSNVSGSVRRRRLQDPRPPPAAKRIRLIPSSPQAVSSDTRLQSPARQFVHSEIIVVIDGDLAADTSAPPYIIIGIGAIISLQAQRHDHEDIRYEHLDYEKFGRLLTLGYPAYDPQRMALSYDTTFAGGRQISEEVAHDEFSFARAVGLLHLQAQTDDSSGDIHMTITKRTVAEMNEL
jgi:hypothetical protein